MERNRLTFLVITDPSRPAHTFQISHRVLRFAIGGLAAALMFILLASSALVLKLGDLHQASRLQEANALLVADVQRMQETVDQLTQSLATISERDRRYRLLAGLPEIDPEVRQVGIGGPGTPSAESEPLLVLDGELGREVYSTTSDLNRLLRQSNLLQASLREASTALEEHRDDLTRIPSIDPTNGWLSSSFSHSRWHPLLNKRRPHEGIDISAPRGTPVTATADGQVTYAGWRPGYGWTVEIDHGNGIKTRYAHNQKTLRVEVGDRVRRGDTLALVGASGLAKGPHVHYEVLVDGQAVNPVNYRLSDVIVE
ncbi:MAG: M23 family metallopeptidase [Gemmatimonadetes bacterium]|uniref:M23 family metallopeptidase n=1 Tax=Candidatus Kutchimonas denitrificans TaxID=3056748 RepID=A0AAE4ZD03_9BACT|nr:M23 family metallopeptidase [Gemmatimonadota bacterium]NIR76466.1 M23 family metallopeptidase [Candidatus Kutchimonas denitrificans]NIS03284.1 M23 family metallopeptidase [Gemmatimonadota bacterium]NIT69145.1 M23 family metallopeptidase [Gemmatimonadota bacterium]NIU54537.1 peptidoglycan DD-metalloendopeptidase family protein [Gemmatimonadota bacterium]